MSARIGADPAQTRQAIDAALPMLLAALSKEAADPQRSAGLKQAIREDHDGIRWLEHPNWLIRCGASRIRWIEAACLVVDRTWRNAHAR